MVNRCRFVCQPLSQDSEAFCRIKVPSLYPISRNNDHGDAHAAAPLWPGAAYSVSAWLRVEAFDVGLRLVVLDVHTRQSGSGHGGHRGITLFIDAHKRTVVMTCDKESVTFAGVHIDAGRWYHLVVTHHRAREVRDVNRGCANEVCVFFRIKTSCSRVLA